MTQANLISTIDDAIFEATRNFDRGDIDLQRLTDALSIMHEVRWLAVRHTADPSLHEHQNFGPRHLSGRICM